MNKNLNFLYNNIFDKHNKITKHYYTAGKIMTYLDRVEVYENISKLLE